MTENSHQISPGTGSKEGSASHAPVFEQGEASTPYPGQMDIRPVDSGDGLDSVTMPDLFSDLEADLDNTAGEILREGFSADGVGTLGLLYGRMARLHGRAAEDAWSLLLEFAVQLERADYFDAVIHLLSRARFSFDVPDRYTARVERQIKDSEDLQTYIKIKRNHDEGNDETARNLLTNLSDKYRAQVKEALEMDAGHRKRTRRAAFIAGGVTGAGLIAISVIGLLYMTRFLASPPDISLPAFPSSGLASAIENRKPARLQAEKNIPAPPPDNAQDAPHHPTKVTGDEAQGALLPPPLTSDTGPGSRRETDRGVFSDGPGSVTGPSTTSPKNTAPGSSSPKAGIQAPGAGTSANSPDAATPSGANQAGVKSATTSDQIYNCALARLVVDRARVISDFGSSPGLEDFSATTDEACSGLPMTDDIMKKFSASIPSGRIENIARGLLKK